MNFLFQPKGLYIFSVIFILYSIVQCFLPPLTKTYKRRKRAIFYSIWSFLFAGYYNVIKVPTLNYTANKYGIPQTQWVFILNFVGFAVIGCIIDMLIISSRGIKSIKKDGIDLLDEEDEAIVKSQTGVIEIYEEIIKAESNTIGDIPAYCQELQKQFTGSFQGTNTDFKFDFEYELTNVIEKYLYYKKSKTQACVIKDDELNKIKEDFDLSFIDFKILEKKLKANEGYLNNFKTTKLLIFPFYSLIGQNENEDNGDNIEKKATQYIVLSSDNVNLLRMEQYVILNILRAFEAFFGNIIYELVSTLKLDEEELQGDNESVDGK